MWLGTIHERANVRVAAIRKHCYDGRFFTDSTAEAITKLSPDTPKRYWQHCQVFAVLCGAVQDKQAERPLRDAFAPAHTLGKCCYVFMFYASRAFFLVGPEFHTDRCRLTMGPWRGMVDKNLTTWEADDVRERSDCHAWGSVPIYELGTEVAGVLRRAPGCGKTLFDPKPELADSDVHAKLLLGGDNLATVSLSKGRSLGQKVDGGVTACCPR